MSASASGWVSDADAHEDHIGMGSMGGGDLELSYQEEEDTYVPYAEGEDAHEEEEDTCMAYEEQEDTWDLELVDYGSAHEMQLSHPFSEGGWGGEGQGVSLSALMVQETANVTANVTGRPRSGAQGARDMYLPPPPEDVRQWVLDDAQVC